MVLLAEALALDGNTAVSGVLVIAIVSAALKVRSWITHEKDERVAGDHRLELMISANASDQSGIHKGSQ